LFRREQRATLDQFVAPGRRGSYRGRVVKATEARQQSVVWAAQRLRADLVSLMPVDVYREVGSINVKVPTPAVLKTPSSWADSQPMTIGEWIGSGQVDLDAHGNSFGVIRAVDALNKPAQIDLIQAEDVTARVRDGRILYYRICGEKTDPRFVWHERQFTVGGLPMGLSPIAHAAMQIAGSSGAQSFATDWFANGAVPSAHLKNTEMTIPDLEKTAAIKDQFLASTAVGEPFVSGKDWTYDPIAAKAAESGFIEQMEYSDLALCRFFGVPADMVDVESATGSVTYANVTQRNVQLLVMNLGGAVKRREDTISTRVLPDQRVAKLNRNAVLAMDPKTRADLLKAQIDSRQIAPSEARELEDREPFTEAQYAEFDRLFGKGTDPIAALGAALSGQESNGDSDEVRQARSVAELIQKIYLGVGTVISDTEARDIANRAGAGLAPGGIPS
jgi:HK97 family phage portal protein